VATDNSGDSSSQATWRWPAVADELADEIALFQRAAGEQGWLGRCRIWQKLLRPPASCHGRPDGGAEGLQERLGWFRGDGTDRGCVATGKQGSGAELGDAAARADACNTHVLLVARARTRGAWQNANACQEALLPTGLYRYDLVAKA
jgi:hypothetical protein